MGKHASTELTAKAFPYLGEADISWLADHLDVIEIGAGQDLFTVGSPADSLYVLLEGRVAVSRDTGFNDRAQVIALMSAGAVVGEGSLAGKGRRSTTVQIIEDSFLLKMNRQLFDELETERPAMAALLLKHLLSVATLRLERCSERLVHIL